jgi:hypothetical protein
MLLNNFIVIDRFVTHGVTHQVFSTQALVSFKKYMPPPEVRNMRRHIFFEGNKCL